MTGSAGKLSIPGDWRIRRWGRRRRAESGGEAGSSADAGGQSSRTGTSSGTSAVTNTAFGGGKHEGELVTVYSAGSFEEAHVIKGRLESEDIPVYLKYRALSVLYGSAMSYGGVEVQVPEALEDRARGILDEGAEGLE